MASTWWPLDAGGAPIDDSVDDATGLWLCESSDLVATDAASRVALWTGDALPAIFPRNWPAAFKDSRALKALLNKSMLKGLRCRAITPVQWARDAADAAGIRTHPMHSFSNALAVSDKLGWQVVRGFCVFERANCGEGESFVAIRHWWNATADGTWLDLTPKLVPSPPDAPDDRVLLVESPLGAKQAAALTPARRAFAKALAARLARGAAALRGEHSKDPSDVSDAPAVGSTATHRSAPAASPSKSGTAPVAKRAGVDYSKWNSLDVSDEEGDDALGASLTSERKAQADEQRRAEGQQKQQAEAQGLRAAIDAAALASAVGNTEALEAMMEQAKATAPLDPAMEAVLESLPEAARIAARASASAAAAASGAEAYTKNTAAAAKEPTLAELLQAQQISLDAEELVSSADSRLCPARTLRQSCDDDFLDSDSPSRGPPIQRIPLSED